MSDLAPSPPRNRDTPSKGLPALVATAKAGLLAIASLLTACALLGGFALWVRNDARAQAADAGVKAEVVRTELEEHKRDSAQAHRQLRDDMHELQLDMRAVYRAIRDGRAQPRLEQPLAAPDGGP